MNINTPYFPTATQLREAVEFKNFDAELNVVLDEEATQELGKKYYKVAKSFRFYLNDENLDVWAYVPAGFLTDGASVPRPFWWIVAPWGKHGQAAVLHDILCEAKTLFKEDIPFEISRKDADEIFLEALKVAGVNRALCYLMYGVVRTWSKFGWGSNKATMAKKRLIETEYMKQYGTYREPTAIMRQVTTAIYASRRTLADLVAH